MDGCIKERMACNLSGNSKRRGMKLTGTTTSHKCPGDEGSKSSIASISQAVSYESYSFLNRQCNSLVLSCENREKPKQVFNRIGKRSLGVSPTPWDDIYCRSSSKLHERGDKFAVKMIKGKFRVETPSTNISDFSDQRKTRNGSFCFSTVSSTSTVHCMENGSIQSGNGCNATNFVQSVPLCFPNIFNNKQVFKKDSVGPSKKDVDCGCHMAVSFMVPNPFENVNRETTSFTTPPTSSIEPPGIKNIDKEQSIRISCMYGFRQRLLETGISERASKLSSSSGRHGGLTGVVKEKLVYFDALWAKWII